MKKRILVVKDHAITLRSLKNYFMAVYPKVEIKYARNGREAVDWVAVQPPDVVVMDLVMPHLDGARATQEIKAGWPEVKVVLLLLDPKQGKLALESGADAYLLIGSDPHELVAVLGDLGLTIDNCN